MRKLDHLRRSVLSPESGAIGLTDTQKQALKEVYQYLLNLAEEATHTDKIEDQELSADDPSTDQLLRPIGELPDE